MHDRGPERDGRDRGHPDEFAGALGYPAAHKSDASAGGTGKLLGDGPATLTRCTGTRASTKLVVVRAGSAYHDHPVVATARRAGARFSITVRANPSVRRVISSVLEEAWIVIEYSEAVRDEEDQRWVSDVEVAEIEHTAPTGRREVEHVTDASWCGGSGA